MAFGYHEDLERLDKVIAGLQSAIEMATEDDERMPEILGYLGVLLRLRFERLGNVADIDDSIALSRRSVNLMPKNDPDRVNELANLGNSLMRRFERFGDITDIDKAITSLQAVVDLAPKDDADRHQHLSNLAASLDTRFEQFGHLADLNHAIELKQAAIDCTPDGHSDKPFLFGGLGLSLMNRFIRLGDFTDIDNAVASRRAAVDLTPEGHPTMAMHLANLGNPLQIRFELFGNIADLDDAISSKQAAVNLTPDDHADKPGRLSNLGVSLAARFQRIGDPTDIDKAIISQKAAVDLTPDGHLHKAMFLNSLGISLKTRFHSLGNLTDLENAIASAQAAVDLTPDNYSAKPMYLQNLGKSLQIRFQSLGNRIDINNAIVLKQAAVELTPDGHPYKTDSMRDLGYAFWLRYLRDPFRREDAETGIKFLSAAANSRIGAPAIRFGAAKEWRDVATFAGHSSLLAAYDRIITIIPLVAWLGLPITDRHQHLVKKGKLAMEAAAAAISFEQYDKALEWLEQGRSIVWTQILQLRTPVDDLRDVQPDLAKRLVQVSRLLDQGAGRSGISDGMEQSGEEQGRRYRALTAEWESLVEKVRSLPNFENFLKPLNITHLIKAAQKGTIIVSNIAEERCDALALIPGLDKVVHIPLPNVTSKRITELANELKDSLYGSGVRMRGERAAKKVEDEVDGDYCKEILAELWTNLVKPILDSLGFSAGLSQLFCLKILIIYTTAQPRYASTNLVVCYRATCLSPNTRCRHIRFRFSGCPPRQLRHIIVYTYRIYSARTAPSVCGRELQAAVSHSVFGSWYI
jgi:tetratricopeptide (TPR) repeat protein